jgi:uncharacterized protein (DUF697 family)
MDSDDERKLKAESVVKSNVLWSLGAGLIPFPLADLFALTTVQVRMLAQLADLYGVPYTKDGAKGVLASLLSGSAATGLSVGTHSTIKSIPVFGQTVGAAATSIYGGALTYAVGCVFIRHFESGGTLLDFDASKVKDSFKDLYAKGRDKVRNWRSKPVEPVAEEQAAEVQAVAEQPGAA